MRFGSRLTVMCNLNTFGPLEDPADSYISTSFEARKACLACQLVNSSFRSRSTWGQEFPVQGAGL